MKGKNIYKIFIVLSLMLGMIFSILIPLYQVPDEVTHLNLLYSNLGNDIYFTDYTNNYGDTTRIIGNYDEKINLDEYFSFDEKLNIIDKIKKIDIHVISYFPQTIGIIVSELFNLPILVAVTISEFFAVIFYTFICLIALRLIPIKKELMMMIMLLPMCIQQMGSFSYDMILICFSFLFISYIFYLKYKKKSIDIKDLGILVGILSVIALVKIPYVLLGLLIFILPTKKIILLDKIKKIYSKNKKIKLAFTLICVAIIVGFVLIKFLLKIDYVKVLFAFILNPIEGIKLIIRTLMKNYLYYPMSIVGYFGWLDTPVSILFLIFIIIFLLIVNLLSKDNNSKKYNLKLKERIYILSLGIFLSLIIIISLYNWTLGYLGVDNSNLSIYHYSYYMDLLNSILGVQGRYFIPVIPLFFIPFDLNLNGIKNRKIILIILQIIYYIILFTYMLIVVLKRYWLI